MSLHYFFFLSLSLLPVFLDNLDTCIRTGWQNKGNSIGQRDQEFYIGMIR